MRVALINPRWTFDGSIYFGCCDPHLPLEHGYAKAMLEARGHEALLIDAHLMDLSLDEVRAELDAFAPEMTVVTTAPTYLFWRCAPPELRVPKQTVAAIREVAGALVAVGPHGSATPAAVLEKLGVDVVVMGECEETLARLADGEKAELPGVCLPEGGGVRINGGPQAAAFVDTPPLFWPDELILLRQGAVSQPVPPARAGCASGRDRRAARARRRVPLLHRRDLPAQPAVARGARCARPRVRRADPD
jgi:anaerobic magnesium-protoporphyrin IX monomethyl ester cyclase